MSELPPPGSFRPSSPPAGPPLPPTRLVASAPDLSDPEDAAFLSAFLANTQLQLQLDLYEEQEQLALRTQARIDNRKPNNRIRKNG